MRLFVGVAISEELRDRVAERMRWLKPRANERREAWTFGRPENLHFTLKFLGEVDEALVPSVAGALQRAAQGIGPIRLELTGIGCFPNPRRARILWMGVSHGGDALTRLAERVEDELSALHFPREDRPFSPHLTLARLRRGTPPQPVERVLHDVPRAAVGEEIVGEIILYKSTLSPGGSKYDALLRVPLVVGAEAEAPPPP